MAVLFPEVALPDGLKRPTKNNVTNSLAEVIGIYMNPNDTQKKTCVPRKRPSYFPFYWLFNRAPGILIMGL